MTQPSFSREELIQRATLAPEDIVRIISISRGKSEGRPEGAKRPTAGHEPREFSSRGEGGRVPPFFEKLPSFRSINAVVTPTNLVLPTNLASFDC